MSAHRRRISPERARNLSELFGRAGRRRQKASTHVRANGCHWTGCDGAIMHPFVTFLFASRSRARPLDMTLARAMMLPRVAHDGGPSKQQPRRESQATRLPSSRRGVIPASSACCFGRYMRYSRVVVSPAAVAREAWHWMGIGGVLVPARPGRSTAGVFNGCIL